MNRRNKIIGIVSGTAMLFASAFLALSTNDLKTVMFRATSSGRGGDNTLSLSSTSYVTTESFTSGSFDVFTPSGNPITFSYVDGKSNSNGLITLDKTYVGNSFADYCYIGNDDAITSVSSISVNFDGGTLVVFASNNKTDFYKVDVLTASGSTVLGNGYLYYRFVNGNHTTTPINLNSISFDYSCVPDDDSSEASDMSNNFTLNGKAAVAGGVALDTSTHCDAYNSSQSLKFTSPFTVEEESIAMGDSTAYMWQFGWHLPRKMTGEELHNMKISMKVNSELTSKGDGKTVEIAIYPSTKYYSYASNSVRVKVYPSAGKVGWYDMSVDFSTSSTKLNSDDYKNVEFEYLFVRPNHVAPVESATEGYLFVDELRLEYVHDYPVFDSSAIDTSPEEIDDISNNAFVAGYDTKDGDLDYLVKSENSYRSRAVTPSGDTCRFHYDGFLVDMAGKTISFDVKLEPSNAYMKVAFFHNDSGTDYRYEVTARYGTETGVTIESLTGAYAGWKHYEIDFDEAMASATKSAKPSTTPANFGFIIAHSSGITAYMDNIYINENI